MKMNKNEQQEIILLQHFKEFSFLTHRKTRLL